MPDAPLSNAAIFPPLGVLAADTVIYAVTSGGVQGTVNGAVFDTSYLQAANNLGDVGSPVLSRANIDAAPDNATYITQTPNGELTSEQALSALATGLMRNTTVTGVVSIATQGVDYYAPGGTDVAVTDGGTGASTAPAARTNLVVAPNSATFITQIPNAELSAEQALSALATGLVKNTTGTGVLSIAVEGTDFSTLPVVDETAIVFETGVPANTLTFDVTPYTAARVATWPDASMTVAGLEVAQTFTAAQTIDGSVDAIQLTVQANGTQTNPVLVVETSAGADIFEVSNDYKLQVRDKQVIFVPDQTDFVGTIVFGDGGGSLSNTAGFEGQLNLFFGFGAGNAVTTGHANLLFGYGAGQTLTTGFRNTFIGFSAGDGKTTSADNVGIGSESIFGAFEVARCTAYGYQTLKNVNGDDNIAVGYLAVTGASTGIRNIGIGNYALSVPGSRNVGIGFGAGEQSYADGCVFLGYFAGRTETNDDRLYIANTSTTTPLIYGEFDNNQVGINIGSAVAATLHIDQPSTTAAIPVAYFDQADVSEEMFEFNTTIGIGNAIEAVGAKTLTTTHFIKVTLPGALTRYFPVGTIA